MWSLCLSSDGDFIRNPNEILYEWSYEQVTDALEIKQIRARRQARMDAERAAASKAR